MIADSGRMSAFKLVRRGSTVAITRQTVLHIAKLARLSLEEDEVDALRADLEQIVNHVAELDRLDTSNVAPTAHLGVDRAPLRPDEVHEGLSHSEALKEAPSVLEGGFRVPGFVDET